MTALLVARPLFPSESAATHGDGLSTVMLWIALGVFWLLAAIGRPNNNSPLPLGEGQGVRVRTGWIDAAVVLLMVCYAAATLWAVGHGSPRPAINVFWEWIGMGLCFLLARQLIDTRREARAVAAVMIALAVALAGYGLYQRAYELPNTRALYQADPDRAMREAGLWFPPDSPQRKLFEDRLANPEPFATFALTNSLAGFLAPWLVVLAGIACCDVRNRKRLLGVMILLVPVAVCLFLTHSRGGCLAAVLGLALVWPIARGKMSRFGWKAPLAVVVVAVALAVTAAAIGKLDYETAQKSLGYRLQYWRSSLDMIDDHPWLGCGPGNFQDAYTRYKLPEASEEVADPHNFLLEIWTTAGTPAAMAFLAVLGCFAWTTFRDERQEPNNSPEPRTPNPEPRTPNPDAWPFVLAGGAVGFLLSLPLGLLSAAPPETTVISLGRFVNINVATVFLLGLPLAGAAVALLLGWIREGRLPQLLPALAVAVLLLNLLTAGGIGMPGVAGSLWLLMAIGLVGQKPRLLRTVWAWAALGGAIALAVACYATAYSPVLGCQAELRIAERKPSLFSSFEHLERAAEADPWAAEPWRRLAAGKMVIWPQMRDANAYRRFEQAVANLTRLAPNSAQSWSTIGDWYSQAASITNRSGNRIAGNAVSKAVEAYRRTVELYPNSAMNRAKLAEAYRTAGDREAYRREAETALRLDKATPHADKKLPAALRNRLKSIPLN